MWMIMIFKEQLKQLKHRAYKREGYVVILTLGLWLFVVSLNSQFAKPAFLVELLSHNSVYFLCALGVLPLMIMGGIDLSVSGMIVTTGMIMSVILSLFNVPLPLLLLLSVGIGMLLGLLNGFLVAQLNVSSVIVTLATMTMYRGFTRFWFSFNQYPRLSEQLMSYQEVSLFGIALQGWMIIIFGCITFFILRYTNFGRRIYAFGGNENLALQVGYIKKPVTLFVYAYSGFAAGAAAVMHMLLLGQGNIEAYSSLDFDLIIILIVGGLNILGGYGSVFGTIFATSFLVMLRSGLVFAKIPVFWHDILVGAIIILVISYDMVKHRKLTKKVIAQKEEL
jgi:simple sugar transport system permease protein